jgi:sec-independent protein translocase protein TatC
MLRLPRRLQGGEAAELVDHLGELRARIVVSLVAVGAGFGVAYAVHARILTALDASLPAVNRPPITLGITEPFMTSMKVSLFAGLGLALPIVLWQFWSFVAPALDPGVNRAIGWLVVSAALLFAAGAAFGLRVALPAAVHFLTDYDSTLYTIQIRAKDYYSFAIMVLVAVGIVFELPVFVLALVRLRVLSAAKLRRNRRIGYAAVAVVAVALPGVDPITTLMEMGPLMVLFESSIWLSVFFEKRWNAARISGVAPLGG